MSTSLIKETFKELQEKIQYLQYYLSGVFDAMENEKVQDTIFSTFEETYAEIESIKDKLNDVLNAPQTVMMSIPMGQDEANKFSKRYEEAPRLAPIPEIVQEEPKTKRRSYK